jgi:uncharacterized membrane protein
MPDLLDTPVVPAVLHRLHEGGVISAEALRVGAETLDAPPTPTAWATFADRLLLFLGAALVLAGTIYFFAYNWDELGRFLQMGLLAGAIVAAVAGAAWQGARGRFDHPSTQALVLGAAVLVGPLLGVFGTTYQTGADPFGLFLAWAGLTVAWAAVARLPALWLVQVVLWNVALALFWTQAFDPQSDTERMLGVHLATAMNGAAWLVWELLRLRGVPWMAARWAPRVLLVSALVPAVGSTVAWIVDDLDRAYLPGVVLLGGLLAAVYGFARIAQLERGLLALGTTAVLVVTSSVLARVAFEIVEEADSELAAVMLFGISGLVVAAKVALATRWLIHLAPLADTREAA